MEVKAKGCFWTISEKSFCLGIDEMSVEENHIFLDSKQLKNRFIYILFCFMLIS